MDVVVTTESRFVRDGQGGVFCADGTYAYHFWSRYLAAFEHVWVVARCVDGQPRETGSMAVDGPGVTVFPLVDSRGAVGAMRRWRAWMGSLQPLLSGSPKAWVLRLPGQIGMMARRELTHGRIPYAVEVVGDPASVYAPGASRHPLRPWLRGLFHRDVTQACHHATAVSYVTMTHLQQRYPASTAAITANYSSIELGEDAWVAEPRRYATAPNPLRLLSIGTMSQRYKGFHVLLDALAQIHRSGASAQLTLVGDGRYRASLESQAVRLGLGDHVNFRGRVPAGAAVRRELDRADLFVLPSLTEGLPRAMIEAQARALPCLGSRIGGIPELLEPSECVPPGDSRHLAHAILQLADDPARLERLSGTLWERAHEYRTERLRIRRSTFYSTYRSRAEALFRAQQRRRERAA